jgi:uncharacterized repeat protein (TIGR01451 family)
VPPNGSAALTVTVQVADKTAYSTHFHNVVDVPVPGDPTPGDNTPTNDDPFTPNPGMALTKQICVSGVPADCDPAVSADWVASTTLPAGSTATYRITVTNTGDVALADVVVTDTHPEGNKTIPSIAVGGAFVYTYTLPVAAQDSNTASAVGVPDKCTGVCLPVSTPPDTAGHGSPAYSVTKEICIDGDPNRCHVTTASDWGAHASLPVGSSATYRITVTNTGTIDLTNITVVDQHPEGTHTIASLAAGASNVFVYTIPVVAGGDSNTITTTAGVPNCTACGATPPTHVVPTAGYSTGSFTAAKSVCTSGRPADCDPAVNSDWTASATLPVGSVATYRIRVVNTGAVDLADIAVDDTHKEGDRTVASLAAGATFTYTYALPVTAGGQTNVVTSSGQVPGKPGQPDEPVSGDSDHADVRTPAYTVTKQVCVHNPAGPCRLNVDGDWTSFSSAEAGRSVTFRIVVKNTGMVPIGPITLHDTYSQGNHEIPMLGVAETHAYTYTVTALSGTHTNVIGSHAHVGGCPSCQPLDPTGGVRTAAYNAAKPDQPIKPIIAVLPEKIGQPTGGILAHTGSGATPFVVAGSVLIGAGMFLLVAVTRRRRSGTEGGDPS